jgi:hypothetical protein
MYAQTKAVINYLLCCTIQALFHSSQTQPQESTRLLVPNQILKISTIIKFD